MEVIELDDDDSLPPPLASADSADDDNDVVLSSPASPASSTSSSSSAPASPSTRDRDDSDHCIYCGQNSPLLCPEVQPTDRAHKEMMALRDERLQLQEADEEDRPTCHLSQFYVFDEAGHLVDLASTLVEEGKMVYFTGMLYCAWSSDYPEDLGVKVVRGGPIKQWWNYESAIGVTTDKAGEGYFDNQIQILLM